MRILKTPAWNLLFSPGPLSHQFLLSQLFTSFKHDHTSILLLSPNIWELPKHAASQTNRANEPRDSVLVQIVTEQLSQVQETNHRQ